MAITWSSVWINSPHIPIFVQGLDLNSSPDSIIEIFTFHALECLQKHKFNSIRIERLEDSYNIRALERKSGSSLTVDVTLNGVVTISDSYYEDTVYGQRQRVMLDKLVSHVENPQLIPQFEKALAEFVQRIWPQPPAKSTY